MVVKAYFTVYSRLLQNHHFCFFVFIFRCTHCIRLHSPWNRVILQKLTSFQLVKEFSAFYGTRKFITAFTSACHLSLSWASSNQSIPPHPTSWRSILILSSHLRLGLPSGIFPSGFPTKTLYRPLLSLIRATCPSHLILLDFITRTILGEEYRSISSSFCSFLHSLITSFLLGPNMLLNILFSNTLSLRSYLSHCLMALQILSPCLSFTYSLSYGLSLHIFTISPKGKLWKVWSRLKMMVSILLVFCFIQFPYSVSIWILSSFGL